MNFNKAFIGGNLTRDPELRYTPSNTAVCVMAVAVNRKWKDQAGEMREEVTFIDAEAWGKTAEVVNQYFRKGKPIFLEGRLKLDQWDDKEGNRRSRLKLVVESFQFVGGRDDGDAAGGDTRSQARGGTSGDRSPRGQGGQGGPPVGGTQPPGRRGGYQRQADQPPLDHEPLDGDDIPFDYAPLITRLAGRYENESTRWIPKRVSSASRLTRSLTFTGIHGWQMDASTSALNAPSETCSRTTPSIGRNTPAMIRIATSVQSEKLHVSGTARTTASATLQKRRLAMQLATLSAMDTCVNSRVWYVVR